MKSVAGWKLEATGKTTLAHALAAERPLQVISSDVVRKELAGLSMADRRVEPFGVGLYSPEHKHAVYEELSHRAASVLSGGESVILDATFGLRAQRERARAVATEHGAYFFCVESRAGEEAVRTRMQERERRGSTSDARWPVYLRQRADFEPIDELDDWSHIVADTSAPLGRTVACVLAALESRLVPEGIREQGEAPSLEA